MATVDLDATELRVHLTTGEKLGGLSGNLRVPRSRITSLRYSDNLFSDKRGWRVGTGIPGRVAIGHWVGRGYHDLLLIHGTKSGVVVETEGYRYDRLLISTDEVAGRRVAAAF